MPVAFLTLWTAVARAQSIDDLGTLLETGSLAEAASVLRTEAQSATDDPLWAAYAFTDACLLSTQAGHLAQAREDCAEAVARQTGVGDPEGLARALNNRALLSQRRGDLSAAEADYRAALNINVEQNATESATINRLNLAVVVAARGRFDEALRLTRSAERVANDADEPWSPQQELVARINQGTLLEQLEAHRAALDLYLSLLQEIENDDDSPDSATLGHLELNAGVALRNLGDPVAAVERYEAARIHFERAADVAGIATVELNLGLAYFLDLKRPEQGLEAVARACALAAEAGDFTEEMRCARYHVDFLARIGRLDDAREILGSARRRSLGAESRITWLLDLGAARIARAEGDLGSSAELAQRVVDQILDVSVGIHEPRLGAGYVEAQENAFDFAIDLALERAGQGGLEARRRAYALALEVRERQLTRALLGVESAGSGDMESAVHALLQGALDGPLLDLHRIDDEIVRFAIIDGKLEHRRFGNARGYQSAARRIRRALTRGGDPIVSDLRHLAELLDDVRLDGALYLSAPDALAMIPWDILPLGGDGSNALLGDVVDLSILPNAALGLRSGKQRSRQLVWAAVARSRGDSTSKHVPFNDFGRLPALPAAEAEVGRLRRTLGRRGELLTGVDAKPESVLQVLRAGPAVAHFATHTVIDERPGGGAALLLHDGILDAGTLAGADLDVQLAVLAACSTRSNPDGSGRLLGSLTGAWLMAGAEAVVATLWDVDDKTTAAFMEQFYFELGRGKAPREALAATKRRLRSSPAWRNPNLWAAYVLVGDTGPVVRRGRGWLGPTVMLGIALTMLLIWRGLRT